MREHTPKLVDLCNELLDNKESISSALIAAVRWNATSTTKHNGDDDHLYTIATLLERLQEINEKDKKT